MSANGALPGTSLVPLSVGGRLLTVPAAGFEELRTRAAADKHVVTITSVADAYRDLAAQERVFLSRYTPRTAGVGPYGDVRWWNNVRYVRTSGAAAAVPGTSNHGRGTTVDIRGLTSFTSDLYRWMLANAPALGWSNAEGASIGEPWHWVHDGVTLVGSSTGGSTGLVGGGALPTTSLPSIANMEDFEMFRIRVNSSPTDQAEVGKVFIVQFGPKDHCLFQHISPEENAVYDLVNVPMYGVSHWERDLIRSYVIRREAQWSVK